MSLSSTLENSVSDLIVWQHGSQPGYDRLSEIDSEARNDIPPTPAVCLSRVGKGCPLWTVFGMGYTNGVSPRRKTSVHYVIDHVV